MSTSFVTIETPEGRIIVQTVVGLALVGDASDGFPAGSQEITAADRAVDAMAGVERILRAAARMARDALGSHAPHETTIEVKVGFAGASGIPFIASGSAEASLTLTLTWKDGEAAAKKAAADDRQGGALE